MWADARHHPTCGSVGIDDEQASIRKGRIEAMRKRRGNKSGWIERRKRADGSIDFYGRFRVYAIDENGRELPTKIPAVLLGNSRQINEREARKQLELLVKDRPGTQDQPALALRFEDGVAKYKEQYLKNVESSTKRLYESLLKNHLLPALGKLELLELERDYDPIQQLVNRKFHDDKMAWWTVKDMHTVMCSFFQWAGKKYRLKQNPAHFVTLPKRPLKPVKKLATPERLAQLIKALPLQRATMVKLESATGLRLGEVQGLKPDDIRWEEKRIHVHARWDEEEKDLAKRYKSVKSTASERVITLEQEDLDWLARYLEKYGKPPGNFLFRSRSGTPLSRRNTLKRVLAPAAKKLGIEGFTWHYLRHWHGSYMAARGVPPEDLRKRMGHASIITTLQYYVHVVDGQARQAAKVASQLVPLRPEEAADDVA